jgi:sodium transport system ATP-binding protein
MIVVENLVKHFDKVHAVDGVDFAAQDGEVLGLLGANGAGKTTTMRIVSAILKPTSGTVTVDGHDVTREPDAVRRALGVMPENWGLYGHLTVRDHLRFWGELYQMPADLLEARIQTLIPQLGMQEYADRKCEDFSKGMKQKVSLARTLLHEPRNLLLDEPTSGLDVMSARQVRELVRQMRDNGHCVILSTHILSEAERMCDRIVIMDSGRTVTAGTVAELLEKSGRTTLEDAFVNLIGREDVEVI